MWRLFLLFGLLPGVLSTAALAQEKKEPSPRTLPQDAAELGGKKYWQADGVPVITFDGKKAQSKLVIEFVAAKGKATGELTLVADGTSVDVNFELVEKDGKRFLKATSTDKLLPQGFLLEYSINKDGITLKGGKARWVTHEVEFTQGVLFKAGK